MYVPRLERSWRWGAVQWSRLDTLRKLVMEETNIVNVMIIIIIIRPGHYMAVKPRRRVRSRLFFRLGVFGALPLSLAVRVTSSDDLLAGDLAPN